MNAEKNLWADKEDSDQMTWVGMGEYGVVAGDSENHIINTAGVGPCIGIVLYDPETKIAGLMHMLGGLTDIPWDKERKFVADNVRELHLAMMRCGVEEKSRENMQVHIIGGGANDPTIAVAKQWIANLGFGNVLTDIRFDEKNAYKFAFDAKDGTLHTLKNVMQRDLGMLEGMEAMTRYQVVKTADPKNLDQLRHK